MGTWTIKVQDGPAEMVKQAAANIMRGGFSQYVNKVPEPLIVKFCHTKPESRYDSGYFFETENLQPSNARIHLRKLELGHMTSKLQTFVAGIQRGFEDGDLSLKQD